MSNVNDAPDDTEEAPTIAEVRSAALDMMSDVIEALHGAEGEYDHHLSRLAWAAFQTLVVLTDPAGLEDDGEAAPPEGDGQ